MIRSRFLLLPCFALAAGIASAQYTEAVLTGASAEGFGERFDRVGDLTGDGVDDLILGFPGDDTVGVDAGRVDVVDGVSGVVLRRYYGDEAGDQMGFSVSHVGDVNADGVPDILFGAPYNDNGKGLGQVRSGADDSVLLYMRGLSEDDEVSYALAGPGDVNGDGHADVAVSAPGVDLASADMGRVYLMNGIDGSVLHTIDGLYPNIRFGLTLASVGDATGDGLPDLLAGTPQIVTVTGGYMQLIRGTDGVAVHTKEGFVDAHVYDLTGAHLAGVGDQDGDQVADYAVTWEPAFGTWWEYRFYSGATGARIDTIEHNYWKMPLLVNLGDLNADGVDDAAYGPVNDQDDVRVRSGLDGEILSSLNWQTRQEGFSAALRNVGDRDADGVDEVGVGVPGASGGDGAIAVFQLPPCGPSRIACASFLNSTGERSRVYWSGSTSVTRNDLSFAVHNVPANSSGLMIYSPGQAVQALGDGLLCLDPAPLGFILRLAPTTSDAGGVLLHDLDVTAPTAPEGLITPGSTWFFQCWYRDVPAGNFGFNFSDTVRAPFCP